MAKKTFAIFGIFALLLVSLTMVSAAEENGVTLTVDVTSLDDVNESEVYTFVATVENNNGSDLYFDFGTTGWTWNVTGRTQIINGTSETFEGNLTIPASGNKNVILNAYENNTSAELFDAYQLITLTYYTAPVVVPTTEETACEFDFNVTEGTGRLEIVDFGINNKGAGDDDIWNYMDTIEFEVEIENTDSRDDIDDVEVKAIIMFLDTDGNWTDVTNDFELEDDVIDSIGDLKDDDSETVIFEILEVPSDVEEGEYRLYLMAYSDGDEENNCVSEYNDNDFTDDLYFEFEVEGVDYEDAIVVREAILEDVDTYCGENNVKITVPVYNLYEEDEDMILVNIYNSELGIDQYKTIQDLRDGKNEEVEFFVTIPESLDKDRYKLDIFLHFDWDDDEDDMEESSYDEGTTTSTYVNVLGCAIATPSMKPTLESATQKGTELVVKTLITNNGEDSDFVFAVSGYESWAELVSVTPQTSNIKEGEFVQATVVLMPKVSGMQSFKISTTVNGETFNQPISVNIKESLVFFGLSGTTLYLVAGIGAALLLILVVLIAKVARRKPVKAQF